MKYGKGMSKIGKKPLPIPAGVKVEVRGQVINFSGQAGDLAVPILDYLKTELKENELVFLPLAKHKQARANWGTMASLASNALEGVSQGFTKSLEIEGIGFKASMEGMTLVLNVGFTHRVKFAPPPGVKITVEKNIIKVSGVDKNLVGQAAAQIRKIKKPEPYKGKGIHYVGEVIRRKAGKKVAGTGTGAGGK